MVSIAERKKQLVEEKGRWQERDFDPPYLTPEEIEEIREKERQYIRREVSLTTLLMKHGVVGDDGDFRPPTKTAVFELIKWHAGGGSIVAVPIIKLAKELHCGHMTASRLIQGLEADGLIRRFKSCAPGNMYTMEIVGPVPEPDSGPLSPVDEAMLELLSERKNAEDIVQTNEHELALAIDVSHETALLSLISLRRKGYVSSTFALYGRPLIVKVQHDRPVGSSSSVRARGYCMKCRAKRSMHDIKLKRREGAKGSRVAVLGLCATCGAQMSSWTSSSLLSTENGSKEKLEQFLKWREETRRQEEEQLRTLMEELGMEELARV